MKSARYASIGFVGVVAVLMVWLNIAYARQVFSGAPFVDDWDFIERLRGFLGGEMGLRYFLLTHNGHPSLPGRLAFLLSYHLQGLDLLTVRWLALAVVGATTAVAALGTAAIMLRQHRVGGTIQPGFLLGPPIIIGVCASLGQWEIFTFAMGVGNASVNFFGFAAIFAMNASLEGRRWVWLAVSLLCAVGATLSMGQGVLVWPALVLMLVLHPDRRQLLPQGLFITVAFVVAAVLLTRSGQGDLGASLSTLRLGNAIQSGLGLLGVPLMGQVGNALVAPVTLAFGTAVLVISLLGLLRVAAAEVAHRRAMLPFFACMAWGVAALALIVVSRQSFPLPAQLASRYVPIIAPVLVGLVGILGVGSTWSSRGGHLLTALFAIAALGLVVTNLEERKIAPHRFAAFQRMETAMLTNLQGFDRQGIMQVFYIDEATAELVITTTAFMRNQRLGPFRVH